MKNMTLIFCLLFVFSTRMMYSQSVQVPLAISGDNALSANPFAVPSAPAASVLADIENPAHPPVKLTMISSPNPFTSRTTITFTLPDKGKLFLEIRNMFGETVKSLEDNIEQEGSHSMEVTSEHLRPGIYTAIMVLKTNDNVFLKTIRIVCNQ